MYKINLAYYNEEDWQKFLASIDDADSMHDTWHEWHASYLDAKRKLISEGCHVNKIVVDLDKLRAYCLLRGMRNDGAARSQFVSTKT